MTIARTVDELRVLLANARRGGQRIGLVPTMGALHEGHLALVRRCAADCELTVVSVFVNPRQFGAGEDLDAYPRDLDRDAELAAQAGADFVFAPGLAEIYPTGFATSISVAGLSEPLCGATRGAEHFSGVATIVAKLLNIVAPEVAYFGQKDAQQARVIARMAQDLAFPVRIEICPTVRESDGLAMSSRNSYLGKAERERAVGLSRALSAAQEAVAAGARDAQTVRMQAVAELRSWQIDPEYLEVVSPETLQPVERLDGPVLVAVAARVGKARLIDNALISPRK